MTPTTLLQDLPDRWKVRLAGHLQAKGRDRLGASDFPHHLMIRLCDGSEAKFNHAFALRDDSLDEVAVFTEHCGYHVFPGYETVIEIM